MTTSKVVAGLWRSSTSPLETSLLLLLMLSLSTVFSSGILLSSSLRVDVTGSDVASGFGSAMFVGAGLGCLLRYPTRGTP